MNAKIGHYEIVTELGRGGMGVVVKGFEAALNRYVAIKMLSPALAHDEGIKERFLREARSMAALNDPHIIQIYFIGEHEGQPFFAMEFVEGESLSSFLKREKTMSTEQSLRVIYQTCMGLATAHDKGLVHRDIKPANLMLNQRGQIKIADFGIALSSTDFSKKLTSTGELVGTPGYLSPEVCVGQAVDARSDIFSLGIVFFELLTGRMPFTDESPLGLMLEVVRAEIPDVRQLNGNIDEATVAILKKMTAKDPAARYQDCHEIIKDLNGHPALSSGNTISAKPILSAAASTQLGLKTPLPGASELPKSVQQPLAAAAPPAPVAAPPPPVMAAPPPPVAHYDTRPSVLQKQQKSNNTAAIVIPIAAVLALAALGGGAWAFRDQLGFSGKTAPPVATTDQPSTPTSTAQPIRSSTTPPAGNDAPNGNNGSAPVADNGNAPNANPQNGNGGDANGNAPNGSNGNTAGNGGNPTVAENTPPQPIAGVPDEPAGDDRSLGPLRRMAKAERDALARNNGPAPIAQPPHPAGPPKVAVIAIGDPALTGPATQMIEEELRRSGFILVDAEMVPGLSRMLASHKPDLPLVLGALSQAANVRAVTVVRAEPLGSTPISFYGQTDTLNSASLTVRSYDVDSRSPLDTGLKTKVDFTQLNAQEKAQEAVEPELGRLVGSLENYRPKKARG